MNLFYKFKEVNFGRRLVYNSCSTILCQKTDIQLLVVFNFFFKLQTTKVMNFKRHEGFHVYNLQRHTLFESLFSYKYI